MTELKLIIRKIQTKLNSESNWETIKIERYYQNL